MRPLTHWDAPKKDNELSAQHGLRKRSFFYVRDPSVEFACKLYCAEVSLNLCVEPQEAVTSRVFGSIAAVYL